MIKEKYELPPHDCDFIRPNTTAVNTGLYVVVSVSEATGLAAFSVGRDETFSFGRMY
jgi:hypothetical protein